jgi:hypothetical protein
MFLQVWVGVTIFFTTTQRVYKSDGKVNEGFEFRGLSVRSGSIVRRVYIVSTGPID